MLGGERFIALWERLTSALRTRAGGNFDSIGVLFMGDFAQLDPVGGTSLPKVAVNQNGPAGRLFAEFNVFFLTTNQRVDKKDVAHLQFVQALADTGNKHPVTRQALSHIKQLTRDDFSSAAGRAKWSSAVVVTSCNKTCTALNKDRIFAHARAVGMPVLCWRLPLASAGLKNGMLVSEIYKNAPGLTQYFVPGAPAAVNDNLNTTRRVANGTRAVCHSVVLDPTYHDVQDIRHRYATAQPGELIDLETPPAYVYLAIMDTATSPRLFSSAWAEMTAADGHVIIPVQPVSDRNVEELGRVLDFPPNFFTGKQGPAKTLKSLHYKAPTYSIAYAVTFHKVQGLTADAIILDLAKASPLNLSAFYVACTRVKESSNMRTITTALTHLTAFTHDPWYVAWRACLKPHTSTTAHGTSLQCFRFDVTLAAQHKPVAAAEQKRMKKEQAEKDVHLLAAFDHAADDDASGGASVSKSIPRMPATRTGTGKGSSTAAAAARGTSSGSALPLARGTSSGSALPLKAVGTVSRSLPSAVVLPPSLHDIMENLRPRIPSLQAVADCILQLCRNIPVSSPSCTYYNHMYLFMYLTWCNFILRYCKDIMPITIFLRSCVCHAHQIQISDMTRTPAPSCRTCGGPSPILHLK